jgi:uncharacterized protein
MKYRRFGKLDWEVSVLGFGCMRLPVLGEKPEDINEPLAIRMIRDGIDQGINYVDTAYAYHGGQSEVLVGKALKDGYREKVRLATKMPTWLTKTYADFDKYLDEQLGKLQTDHVDFYLLHTLNAEKWENLQKLNVFDWAEKTIASGKIRHLGFSFHDNYQTFNRILNGYDKWTFCQIQYNYMDEDEQAGTKGLQDAAAKGLAVVIMEPLRGGKLATPPDVIQSIFKGEKVDRTPADWALQWVWNHSEVTLLLSGMSAPEQVTENLASADCSGVDSLTYAELQVVRQARDKFLEICPIPCTQCQYCMPCPNGVNIPRNFDIFNKGAMFNDWGTARWMYSILAEGERASACIDCNECETKCPQQIPISDWMPYVEEILGKKRDYDGRCMPGVI